MSFVELFGYFGSVLVAVSLTMANIKRLRWINLSGAIIFTIYGFLIDAWPVTLLNGWIIAVNIWYLRKLYQTREKFDLIETKLGIADPVVNLFLDHYRNDINRHFGKMQVDRWQNARVWMTYRDLQPAGIFIFEINSASNTVEILLDYAAPEYRDLQNARLIFKQECQQLFSDSELSLMTAGHSDMHVHYLLQMGFLPSGNGMYVLKLSN